MAFFLGDPNSTHGFQVLKLAHRLDETRYTSRLAGINLDWAGEKDKFIEFVGEWESSLIRVESEKDTAAYLDDGNFLRTFATLRADHDFGELVYFTVLSMKVGAKTPKRHRRYVQQLFIPSVAMSVAAQAQFRQAVDEHINGTPYRPERTGNTMDFHL